LKITDAAKKLCCSQVAFQQDNKGSAFAKNDTTV
jgi:hypothetical protein